MDNIINRLCDLKVYGLTGLSRVRLDGAASSCDRLFVCDDMSDQALRNEDAEIDLRKNPFRVLGASYSSSRDELSELCEDKSLFSDPDACNAARSALVNSVRRLDAEVSWLLCSNEAEAFPDIDKIFAARLAAPALEEIRRLLKDGDGDNCLAAFNLAAHAMTHVRWDPLEYDVESDFLCIALSLFDALDPQRLCTGFNGHRKAAGLPALTSQDVENALAELSHALVHDACAVLNRLQSFKLANYLAALVSYFVEKRDKRFPKPLLEIVNRQFLCGGSFLDGQLPAFKNMTDHVCRLIVLNRPLAEIRNGLDLLDEAVCGLCLAVLANERVAGALGNTADMKVSFLYNRVMELINRTHTFIQPLALSRLGRACKIMQIMIRHDSRLEELVRENSLQWYRITLAKQCRYVSDSAFKVVVKCRTSLFTAPVRCGTDRISVRGVNFCMEELTSMSADVDYEHKSVVLRLIGRRYGDDREFSVEQRLPLIPLAFKGLIRTVEHCSKMTAMKLMAICGVNTTLGVNGRLVVSDPSLRRVEIPIWAYVGDGGLLLPSEPGQSSFRQVPWKDVSPDFHKADETKAVAVPKIPIEMALKIDADKHQDLIRKCAKLRAGGQTSNLAGSLSMSFVSSDLLLCSTISLMHDLLTSGGLDKISEIESLA